MPVPNTFATATAPIPLSQLDTNFATPITLGNTAIQLGNTVTTLNNMTLANVTISSGNVTITNVSVTTANVTTANIGTSIITTSETLNYGTANGVAYLNASKVLTTGTALVFDGSNLGLGAAPSASWASTTALQVGSVGGAISSASTQISLSYNWVATSGGNKYITNGFASIYQQNAGSHAWYIAPSGTAGNAITFTQAMTLDASGNFFLGTTSALGAADRMSVSGGNITVSRTSGILTVVGDSTQSGYVGTASNHAFVFLTNSSERARITSGGDFLVGTTSASIGNTTGSRFITSGKTLQITSDDGTNPRLITNNVGFGDIVASFRYTSVEKGSISITSTAVSFNTSSDYRLKYDIAPMTGALAKVAALKPCTYKWKVDGSDGEGFIAHELAEVVPDAVSGEKDAVNEDGSIKPQGIDTSFLVATLTAAIQELKAELDATKAKVAALENA